MTVRIPPSPGRGSEIYTIDYRETAPALANTSMYVGFPDSARYGGLAVGVPGELRGLEEAHRRWGSLSWKRLVEPSVSLAKGWEVDKELSNRMQVRSSWTSCVLNCSPINPNIPYPAISRPHAEQHRLACDICTPRQAFA
jgi:hypothetical protein